MQGRHSSEAYLKQTCTLPTAHLIQECSAVIWAQAAGRHRNPQARHYGIGQVLHDALFRLMQLIGLVQVIDVHISGARQRRLRMTGVVFKHSTQP